MCVCGGGLVIEYYIADPEKGVPIAYQGRIKRKDGTLGYIEVSMARCEQCHTIYPIVPAMVFH